jgi:hypothetical protein
MEIYRPYISEAIVSRSFGYTERTIEMPDGKKASEYILEGEFQRASVPNKNNRVYEEALLKRETDKIIQLIKERNGHLMGMDHPTPNPNDPPQVQAQQIQRIGMENACALTVHLEMNNGVVYGKAKALAGDFGTGDKLVSFIKAGFKPGVSSRGLGGDPVFKNGYMYVPESYKMVCWDFVTNPSVYNSILENAIHEEMYLMEQAKKHKKKLWDVLINISGGK